MVRNSTKQTAAAAAAAKGEKQANYLPQQNAKMIEEEEEEEAERMAALKRAYADIILNTAKEAASRLLVSERKALRFQQDLYVAKEEALNMLLRLKQIMDSKIAEAERASLGQRLKVQELEAQLNEAEETVVDLRMELKRVQDELEKMKNNFVKPMVDQTEKGNSAHADQCQERKICSSNSIVCPLVSGPEHVLTSYAMSTPSNQRTEDDRCCFMFQNATTPTVPSDDLPSRHYYDGKTDLTSIVMRSKENELYRNGCTQRIRAFEQKRLTGNLPLHGQNDNGYSHTKNELIVGDDGIIKQNCTVTSPRVEDMAKSKEKVLNDNGCKKGGVVRFFRRSLRKQRAKYDPVETITHGTSADKLAEAQVPSDVVPCSEVIPCSQVNMTESDENPSKEMGEDAQKDSNSIFAPISTKDRETVEDIKHHLGILSENEDPTSPFPVGSVQNDRDSSKVLIEESVLTCEDNHPHSSDVSICKTNLETVDVPLVNFDSKDEKPCGTVGTPTQAVNDKLLKYTFRRKRKRVPLSNHNDDSSVEKKSSSKRSPGDKQVPLPEPPKSTLIMESSRDSRRLVQVARQLISLSGKRWR